MTMSRVTFLLEGINEWLVAFVLPRYEINFENMAIFYN